MLANTPKLLFLLAVSTASVQAGAYASEQVSFDDVSDLLGFLEYGTTSFAVQGPSSIAGMTWFDYDNDGDLDLFVCTGPPNSNVLFENDNGSFTDVTATAGLTNVNACISTTVADFDNDGHLDLLLGAEILIPSGVVMYRNNGDGTFADVTASSGLPAGIATVTSSAADYDGDGYLDIFIAGGFQWPDSLFKNNGDFTFTDVSAASGVGNSIDNDSCSAAFADFTGDGLPDIVLGVCLDPTPMPLPTLMWTNNGDGTFSRSEISTPIFGMVALAVGLSLGIAVGDIDHDGDLDLFITSGGTNAIGSPHQLLINDGNGNFVNTIAETEVPLPEFGWSATFTDFDNDGHLDLMFTGSSLAPPLLNFNRGRLLFGDGTGNFVEAPTCGPPDCTPCGALALPAAGIFAEPNLCYTSGAGCAFRDLSTGMWAAPFDGCNNPLLSFCDGCYRTSECSILGAEEAACVPALGVDLSASRSTSVSSGDFDGDGFDDIAIMTSDYSMDYQTVFSSPTPVLVPGAITHTVLLKNNAESANNWIKLKLVALTGNRSAIGSRLVVNSGQLVQYDELRAITSPMASSKQFPSFGLGKRGAASVVVTWYGSGLEEKFCVRANQMTELVEGDGRSPNASCPFENKNGNGNGNRNGNRNGFRNGNMQNMDNQYGGR